jgi:hypothetical protein
VDNSVRDARSLATLNELIGRLQGFFHLTEQAMQGSVAGALDNLSAGRLCPASSKIRAATWHPDFCDLDLMQKNDPMDHENNAIICCPA